MSNVTYQTRNGSIEQVKIEATYKRSRQIPLIGQRKRMKVNGTAELLTLNEIRVVRFAEWNEERERFDYKFSTSEEWGEYFIS
jgi:hypothetical protein